MKQLNIQDAGFIYQETKYTPMHISGLGIYNQGKNHRERISMEETFSYIETRLHNCPILKNKLYQTPGNWERPYWVEDKDFDIKRHVFQHGLPSPGNQQQLNELISRLLSTQLDMHIPLWECHIIEGVNDIDGFGKGSFAILTKVHHSCIDGSSGNNVVTVLHDLDADAELFMQKQPENEIEDEDLPGKFEMMAKAFATNIWTGFEQSASVMKHIPSYAKVARDLYQGKIDSGAHLTVPATRFNKRPSTKRVYTSADFSLDDVKAIKNAQGTTVNDVMVAVVAGGLRYYLEEINELPKDSLGAMLPKNIRDEHELEAKEGNRVGGLVTTLHTNIEDPLERLHAIRDSVLKAKEFSNSANTDLLFPNLMGGFLYPRAGKALTRWAQKKRLMEKIGPVLFNTVITNVPGPNFNLYHAGAPMQVFSGVPPLPDGIGLAHAIYSYCGRINLSALSCPLMLEDAELYSDCLLDSFDDLYDAAMA